MINSTVSASCPRPIRLARASSMPVMRRHPPVRIAAGPRIAASGPMVRAMFPRNPVPAAVPAPATAADMRAPTPPATAAIAARPRDNAAPARDRNPLPAPVPAAVICATGVTIAVDAAVAIPDAAPAVSIAWRTPPMNAVPAVRPALAAIAAVGANIVDADVEAVAGPVRIPVANPPANARPAVAPAADADACVPYVAAANADLIAPDDAVIPCAIPVANAAPASRPAVGMTRFTSARMPRWKPLKLGATNTLATPAVKATESPPSGISLFSSGRAVRTPPTPRYTPRSRRPGGPCPPPSGASGMASRRSLAGCATSLAAPPECRNGSPPAAAPRPTAGRGFRPATRCRCSSRSAGVTTSPHHRRPRGQGCPRQCRGRSASPLECGTWPVVGRSVRAGRPSGGLSTTPPGPPRTHGEDRLGQAPGIGSGFRRAFAFPHVTEDALVVLPDQFQQFVD